MALSFNLRGIPPEAMSMLKREAQKQHTSVNLLILKFIEQGISFPSKPKKNVYHDLDKLAGTWSEEEVKAFHNHTKSFEKIDRDLWA